MANFHVQDDLDSVQSTQSASPQNSTTTSPQSVDLGGIDWADARVLQQGDGLDRIRPKAGETIRFALVPGAQAKSGNVHFLGLNGKTARMYICDGASCVACRSGDQPKRSLVALAVVYSNADPTTGKLPVEAVPVYRIGYVSLSTTNYNSIVEAPTEGTRPTEVDYRMTFDGRRYDFHVVAQKSRHSQRGETDIVKNLAQPFLGRLAGKLGSPIPPNSSVGAVPPPVANGSSHYTDF